MVWNSSRNTGTGSGASAASAILAGLLLNPATLLAQGAPVPPRDATVARQLAASEARVRMLQMRVERLESRLDALANTQAAGARSSGPSASSGSGPGPQSGGRAAQTASGRSPAPAASGAGAPGQVAARSGPGSFAVDEESAQRALERTLTQSGALLLPPRAYTITPSFSFARNESGSTALATITNPATGVSNAALLNQTLRRNEFALRAEVKFGLPWESQLELDVPVHYVRATQRNALGGEESANGSGAGDLSLGVAKTLLREKGARPDLIGRLTYNTGTGRRSDGNVSLPGGFRGLTGEIVALKRQDPLAFFASAAYGVSREEDGIKPGDLASLTFGTVLAASPDTSLQFGFSQVHRQKQELNGVKQTGSAQTYGIVSIGASSVLSRNVMLITSVGIGVGEDAPNYSLNVSLPITFR